MKRNLFLITLLALMLTNMCAYAQSTYTMITSASGLEAGAKYLIVGISEDGSAYAMGYQKTNNRFGLNVAESNGSITATVATNSASQTEPFEFELGGNSGAWTLYDALYPGYLYAGASDANKLKTQETNNANGEWNITIGSDGAAVVVAQGENTRNVMRFNDTDPAATLFNCYGETSSIINPVYFFKQGGAPVIDPEPSNYPTNFTAQASALSVDLTWTDATGAQLPRAYLILGSTGTITVPTDGVAVANDTDASDGNIAYNVNQGTQAFTFSGLNGNTTYHFAIFPYTNSGANIDYKNAGSYPTANATTEELTVLLYEDFDADLGVFHTFDVYGDQTWNNGSYNGIKYAYMNGYVEGVSYQNEDWLISPNLFANGAYQHVYLSFESAYKFDGAGLQLVASTDYDGISEPSEYTWTDITDKFDWSDGNFLWIESGSQDIMPYISASPSTLYIAFVYTSSDEASSSWEVTNVKAYGKDFLSVEENNEVKVSVYPNPADNYLYFNAENDVVVTIMDMAGRTIQQENVNAGEASINVSNIEKGVYFINFEFENGTKAVAKFVKM